MRVPLTAPSRVPSQRLIKEELHVISGFRVRQGGRGLRLCLGLEGLKVWGNLGPFRASWAQGGFGQRASTALDKQIEHSWRGSLESTLRGNIQGYRNVSEQAKRS